MLHSCLQLLSLVTLDLNAGRFKAQGTQNFRWSRLLVLYLKKKKKKRRLIIDLFIVIARKRLTADNISIQEFGDEISLLIVIGIANDNIIINSKPCLMDVKPHC
jgi:hypothetical protein